MKLGQGRENGKDFLKEHPEIAAEIEAAIRGKVEKAAQLATAGLRAEDNDGTEEDEEMDAVAIAEAVAEEASEAEV